MKKYLLIFRACILLVVASLLNNNVYAQKLSKVIVFSKTEGYRHQSIENGIENIVKQGKEINY